LDPVQSQNTTDQIAVTDDEDEQQMSYLPVAAKEMLRQEFDLRQRDGVFTQVSDVLTRNFDVHF
jgi:hypothetical protein